VEVRKEIGIDLEIQEGYKKNKLNQII